jgi:hypothetical protein
MKRSKSKKSLSPDRYFTKVKKDGTASYETDRLVMKSDQSEDEFIQAMESLGYVGLEKSNLHQKPRADGAVEVHRGPVEGCIICQEFGNGTSEPSDSNKVDPPFINRCEPKDIEHIAQFVKMTPAGYAPTILFSYENNSEHVTMIFDVVTINTAILWFYVSQIIKAELPKIKVEIGEKAPFNSAMYPDAEIRLVDFKEMSKYKELFTKIALREWMPHITFKDGIYEVEDLKPSFTMAYMNLDSPIQRRASFESYVRYLNLKMPDDWASLPEVDDEIEHPTGEEEDLSDKVIEE